jgi:phosphomevalonate kinase
VTDAVRQLADVARRTGAVVLPSGAGGGDVALYVGFHSPATELRLMAQELGHHPLELALDARGVHELPGSGMPPCPDDL